MVPLTLAKGSGLLLHPFLLPLPPPPHPPFRPADRDAIKAAVVGNTWPYSPEPVDTVESTGVAAANFALDPECAQQRRCSVLLYSLLLLSWRLLNTF